MIVDWEGETWRVVKVLYARRIPGEIREHARERFNGPSKYRVFSISTQAELRPSQTSRRPLRIRLVEALVMPLV